LPYLPEVRLNLEQTLGLKFFGVFYVTPLPQTLGMRLLERMRTAQKVWTMSVFASANAIRKYKMQELVGLGVSRLWMGLESPQASYSKLKGTDTRQLTRKLREHSIRVQGATIIGLEHHTPDNILSEIEYAVSHDTDFHQFKLYTPVPGTPLYQQMSEEGRMLPDVDYADVHRSVQIQFQACCDLARRFQTVSRWGLLARLSSQWPSLYRITRTLLAGWKRYKDWPDARVRERFAHEMHRLSGIYSSAPLGDGAPVPESRRTGQSANPYSERKVQA